MRLSAPERNLLSAAQPSGRLTYPTVPGDTIDNRRDKFHILQHTSQVDGVRRAEFFRKGGAARDLVRGERRLLLSSWLNLDLGKRRQLNALFALNRRTLKSLP